LNDTQLLLREAHPDDLDQVSLLIRDANLQYEKFLPPEAWTLIMEDMLDVRGRLDKSQLIVAEWAGKLAGAVTLYLDARQ
jgi:hypothetical protein